MKSIMEEASTITKAIENAWDRAGQPQEFTVKILELPKTSFFGLKTAKSAKIALLFNEMTVKIKEHPQKQQARPAAPRQPHDRRDSRDSGARHEGERNTERSQQVQRRPLQPRDGQRDQQRDQQRAERPQERRPDRQQDRPERHDRTDSSLRQEPSDYRSGVNPSSAEEQRTDAASRRTTDRSADRQRDSRDQQKDQRRSQPQAPRQPYRSESQDEQQPRRFEEPRREEQPQRYEQRPGQERETWAPEMVETAQDWVKETLVLMGKPDIKVTPQVSHNYLKLYLDQSVMDDYKQEETQLKSWGSLAMEAVREKADKPLRSLRIILESKR